jgi:hypothetical protein
MEQRTDRLTALYIDAILNFCEPGYRQCAVVTLLDHGLSLDAVLRLLDRPCDRRPNLLLSDDSVPPTALVPAGSDRRNCGRDGVAERLVASKT